MTISTVTAFSGITDKAPASPAYFLSKFSEVYDNLNAMNTAPGGGGSLSVRATGSTTSRTLADRFAVLLNPLDFGAVGDGTTDDTTAIQAALNYASAGGAGAVEFPTGYSFKVTSVLTVGGFTTLVGKGHINSKVLKSHQSDAFQVWGNDVHFLDVYVEGDISTNTLFGGNGFAVNFPLQATGSSCLWHGGGTGSLDGAFSFTTDAGHLFKCSDGQFTTYNITPSGAEPDQIYVRGDTSAAFRQFINSVFYGNLSFGTALDTQFTNCAIRHFTTTAGTSIFQVQSCVLANNSYAHPTVFGDNLNIMACRISGAMTLGAGSNGVFIGNKFTSGGLTDATSGALWEIWGNQNAGQRNVSQNGIVSASAYHTFGSTATNTDRLIYITGSSYGTTAGSQYGLLLDARSSSSATLNVIGLYAKTGTPDVAFTAANVEAIRAVNPVKGAASTIDQAVGLSVENITTGTVNYAIKTGTGLLGFTTANLSVRTLAASAVTVSAANTNVVTNEVVFTVGGASGASLAIHSGGTVYIFNSDISAKAT